MSSITLKSREIPEDAEFAITLSRGTGIKDDRDGLISGNTLGSYAHLHGVAYRELAGSLVEAARKFRESELFRKRGYHVKYLFVCIQVMSHKVPEYRSEVFAFRKSNIILNSRL